MSVGLADRYVCHRSHHNFPCIRWECSASIWVSSPHRVVIVHRARGILWLILQGDPVPTTWSTAVQMLLIHRFNVNCSAGRTALG